MAATEKLSDRIEAEIGCWPSTSTLCAVLRDAYAVARAVEDAPSGRVPKAKVGDLLLFPVSHDFAGKKVKLVVCDERG